MKKCSIGYDVDESSINITKLTSSNYIKRLVSWPAATHHTNSTYSIHNLIIIIIDLHSTVEIRLYLHQCVQFYLKYRSVSTSEGWTSIQGLKSTDTNLSMFV